MDLKELMGDEAMEAIKMFWSAFVDLKPEEISVVCKVVRERLEPLADSFAVAMYGNAERDDLWCDHIVRQFVRLIERDVPTNVAAAFVCARIAADKAAWQTMLSSMQTKQSSK